MTENAIEELHNLYDEDQLILFIGAGVSVNSNAPSWGELTEQFQLELYTKCAEQKKDDSIQPKDANDSKENNQKTFEFNEHITSAQYLYNDNKEKYTEILRRTFSKQLKPNDLSRKIMDLNQSDIVTTNYDALLEESESYTVSQYEVIKSDEDLLKSKKKKKIIKMHGDAKCLSSIVLKEDDYLNYETNKKAIHNYLKHLFFSKTILFIGYGLGDYNVKQILNDIQNYSKQLTGEENGRKHYFAIYKSKKENDKRKEELLEQELKRKNVILIDVSEYEGINYKSNLNDVRGIANYNFLCEIENYTLVESLDESKIKEEIIKRFEQLDEQSYVSTNDILNILEMREKQSFINSTSTMLSLYNKEIYDVLSSGEENILKVLNKSLITKICYVTKDYHEEYILPNAKENFKKIETDILENKLNSIYMEKELHLYFCGEKEREHSILKYYENLDRKNNSFNDLKKQINNILVTNVREVFSSYRINEKEEVKIENALSIERKIKLIERSLDSKSKRRFSELKKIGNFEYSNHTNHYYKIIKKIKEESKREGGFVTSNTDHFGELEKIVQSMYIYPLLNGVASLIYKGDFRQVVNEYAIAYLAPFNRKYRNLKSKDDVFFGVDCNKLFKDLKLTVMDVIFISDMIEHGELVKIIKENDIDTVHINFEKEILYDFFEKYCYRLNELGEAGSFKLGNKFVKNILVFLALIDKEHLYKISTMNLPLDFIIFYLKFHLKSVRMKNLSFKINKTFYNSLFSVVFSNHKDESEYNQYNDFELLLRMNVKLINEDNKLLLDKVFDNYKGNSNIPLWIIDFIDLIGKERVMSKFEISNLNCNSLLTLIANECVPITKEFLAVVEEAIIDYSEEFGSEWYDSLLSFSYITDYEYFKYVWNIVRNIDNSCPRVIYNIVHQGSLVETNQKVNFVEVELIKTFLNDSELRKEINVEKIDSELKEMNELGLVEGPAYYLWGIVTMYRSKL